MATLLYLARILLDPTFGRNFSYDFYIVLGLIALDSQLVFRWWVWTHRND